MNKMIFSSSLACLLFVLVGTFAFPNSLVMQLASTGVFATIFRCAMATLLVVVLFSNPPRRVLVRIAMGATASILVITGIVLSLSNTMHLLDVLLFIELGIVLSIEALELNEDEIDAQIARMRQQNQPTLPKMV